MVKTPHSGSRNVGIVVVLVLVAGWFTPTSASTPGPVTRVSVASDGTQANGPGQLDAAVSADGRYVAFSADATNLVGGDTNGTYDVFVRDRATGQTALVSKASDGTQGDNLSYKPTISADGRYVAFVTSASNLGGGPLGAGNLYVHDRQTGATTLVGKASDGTPGHGDEPAISADGRYVAFSSRGFGLSLVPGSNTRTDVYVHDRDSGTTTRVSVGTGGADPNNFSNDPTISADGRYVTFWSSATNLVANDTNAANDIFVHDRASGTTTRVSVASNGLQANGGSGEPRITPDGRYVAFNSDASNLVAGDTNGRFDIFVHDRDSATTTRASVRSDGGQTNHFSFGPAISADGRFVTFDSQATNLAAGDDNNTRDVFLHDRATGATTLVSVALDGKPGVGEAPSISADGRHVVLRSFSDSLVAGDTNGVDDFFARDMRGDPVVSVGDVAVHEGDSGTRAAVFTVSLSETSAVPVTVNYATVKGSAVGTDFAARSGTVTFAPGTASATVKVAVAGDLADEGDETFTIALSSPSGATIGDGSGQGTIYDDDPGTGRRLAIGDVAVNEGDGGSRVAVFNVSLSKASTSYVTVSFATAKGSAVGADFAAKSGTLSFAPGTTSLNIKVAINPDTAAEGDETFTVNLSSSSGPALADAVGTGTIVDDE